MFALTTVVFDIGLRTAVSVGSSVVWYTGAGLWWLGKRAIYGPELTPEQLQDLQTQELKEQLHEEQARFQQQLLDTLTEREQKLLQREEQLLEAVAELKEH
jgi:uncharacterized membrane protein YfbV (UPF0208 family)